MFCFWSLGLEFLWAILANGGKEGGSIEIEQLPELPVGVGVQSQFSISSSLPSVQVNPLPSFHLPSPHPVPTLLGDLDQLEYAEENFMFCMCFLQIACLRKREEDVA